MSRRPRRTRVYDCNYDLGQSYYKPAIDRLDRKFTGRPLDPSPRELSVPTEVQDRYDRAFEDEDLSTSRRRAEKHIKENNLFDSRGALTRRSEEANSLSAAIDVSLPDDGFDDEFSGVLQRMKASRKKILNDVDLEGTVSSISSKRSLGLSEKLLDSVGINEVSARRIQNGESSLASKRRSFFDEELDTSKPSVLEKWTALTADKDDDRTTSAAAARARQSRARLNDLEEEMETMNQKQAARERRVQQLRALVNESSEDSSQVLQSSMKSARISARSEKKTVTF